MAVFNRKVGRLVSIRGLPGPTPKATQLRPGRIIAVGAGTSVDVQVLHKNGEQHLAVPRWSRTTPSTKGWTRT